MTNQLSPVEQLAFSTVRIETIMKNGDHSIGTGFFWGTNQKDDGKVNPVIVTNKHVIRDSMIGKFTFTLKNPDETPNPKDHFSFDVSDFEKAWRPHPDPQIDLCVMPVYSLVKMAESRQKNIFFITLTRDLLPTAADFEELHAMEDITMIGYPVGIWDEVNNFPVFRKGITATNPKYDWKNRKEFLIDCACFPGSSGSPVLLVNIGVYISAAGSLNVGRDRIKLLGILRAGPQYTASGEVKIVDVPTAQKPLVLSDIPTNLGVVIKSDVLLAFDAVFPQI